MKTKHNMVEGNNDKSILAAVCKIFLLLLPRTGAQRYTQTYVSRSECLCSTMSGIYNSMQAAEVGPKNLTVAEIEVGPDVPLASPMVYYWYVSYNPNFTPNHAGYRREGVQQVAPSVHIPGGADCRL